MNFISKAKIIHNNKYDYSLVNYINSKTNVIIICNKHGEFWQRPDHHLNGAGCPNCAGNSRKSISTFITEANIIHNSKYDYTLSKYINSESDITIICKIHGEFSQSTKAHLNGSGCPKCTGNNKTALSDLLKSFRLVHGFKYDYSLVEFSNMHKNIKIICSIHGIFKQTPNNHKHGQTCPKCNGKFKSTSDFIKEANLIHNNRYDYSNTNYIDTKNHIEIICNIHGTFKQKPNNHLCGNGCPKCKISKGELKILNYLKENNIEFKFQHKFKDCFYKRELPFDFYIEKLNMCIEFNGKQHYKPNKHFGGESEFELRIKRDDIKSNYCSINNIRLIIIKYNDNIIDALNSIEKSPIRYEP